MEDHASLTHISAATSLTESTQLIHTGLFLLVCWPCILFQSYYTVPTPDNLLPSAGNHVLGYISHSQTKHNSTTTSYEVRRKFKEKLFPPLTQYDKLSEHRHYLLQHHGYCDARLSLRSPISHSQTG